MYNDLLKIKDLDNRSINSLLQEGARLVRNKYVEQVAQDRKTRTTLQSRYEMFKWWNKGGGNPSHFVLSKPLFSAVSTRRFWWGFIQLINSPPQNSTTIQIYKCNRDTLRFVEPYSHNTLKIQGRNSGYEFPVGCWYRLCGSQYLKSGEEISFSNSFRIKSAPCSLRWSSSL